MTLSEHYSIRLVCRLLDLARGLLSRNPTTPAAAEANLRAVLLRLAGEWPTCGCRR
jgi:hypothetical protein